MTSTESTVHEIAAKVAEGQRRVLRIMRAYERAELLPMQRNLYIDYQAEIFKEEIRLMVFDALRSVDNILDIPEAF